MYPFLLTGLVVLAVGVAIILGRIPGAVPKPTRDTPYHPLPLTGATTADINQLRFNVVPRGYRMDEVDETLDRLSTEITRLRALAGETDPATSPTAAATVSPPQDTNTPEDGDAHPSS